MKEALLWSLVWVLIGLSFTVVVYFGYEHHWMGMGLAIGRGGWAGERRQPRPP